MPAEGGGALITSSFGRIVLRKVGADGKVEFERETGLGHEKPHYAICRTAALQDGIAVVTGINAYEAHLVVDGAGTVQWDNEDLWPEWYRAITPRTLLDFVELSDGTLVLFGTGTPLSTGGAWQKTTIVSAQGELLHQRDWSQIGCDVRTMTFLQDRDALLAYRCGRRQSMSGQTAIDVGTRLLMTR